MALDSETDQYEWAWVRRYIYLPTPHSCPLPLPLCAPEIEGGAGGFKEFSTYSLLEALGCYDQRGQ